MKQDNAMTVLLNYSDPTVQAAAKVIQASNASRKIILERIRDALQQLRVDVKYMAFDLEATRRERDELRARLGE